MATINSVVNGNWASTGTWSTSGIPTVADLVNINHTVTANGSGMNAGAIAGTGVLVIPTTPGTYTLNCTGNISIPSVSGGSATSPVPSGVNFVISFGAAGKVSATACSGYDIFGYKPVVVGTGFENPYVATLAVSAANGASTVVVSGNVSTWTQVASGRSSVWITQLNAHGKGTAALCRRALSTASYVASSNVTVLALGATLTEAKQASGHVLLETRNVCLSGTSTQHTFAAASNATLRDCQFITAGGNNINGCPGFDLAGSSFVGSNFTLGAASTGINVNGITATDCSYGLYGARGITASGLALVGCGNTIGYLSGLTLSDSLLSGGGPLTNTNSVVLKNCQVVSSSYGVTQSHGIFLKDCLIKNNDYGVALTSGILSGCTLWNQTNYDLASNIDVRLTNSYLNSSIQHSWTAFNTHWGTWHIKSDSFDNGGVKGARKCWTYGGYTTSQAATAHPIFGEVLQMIPGNSSAPTFLEDSYRLQANTTYTWTWIALKDTHAMTATPFLELVDKFNDTLDMGGTALVIHTMDDTEGDWQIHTLTYTPTYDMDVWLRVRAQHGSGNIYFKTWLQSPPESYVVND